MPSAITTLLDIIQTQFGLLIDPDSDGGMILNSLEPIDDKTAKVSNLSFTPTASGVSVRAAQAKDALVFSPSSKSSLSYTIKQQGNGKPPRVEIKLLPLTVELSFLSPAEVSTEGTLQKIDGKVELHFPDLLLVVTASESAKATLEPSGSGALEVTMTPAYAIIGPTNSDNSGVAGIGFEKAKLFLNGPDEPKIEVPSANIFVAPPGISALAMNGGVNSLFIGLGGSGLTGDFQLKLAQGTSTSEYPRFLQNMEADIHIKQNSITLLELKGQIDLAGEVSNRVGQLDNNPTDKINYVLGLTFDNGWQTALTLKGGGGQDYLWRARRAPSNQDNKALNTLGAYAVFSPLLIKDLPSAGSSGFINLGITSGAAIVLASSDSVQTQSVTLFGGELVVHEPAVGPAEAFLFFDLETELNLDIKLDGNELLSTQRPLKVRHKAIGLQLEFGHGVPQINPVFDPAKGFTLDLSDPGLLKVPGPLSDIIQPEGARIARENPLNFEIDLVLKADLGVISVDRASVRLPLDPPGEPTLTALGAHIDVPGALSGSGYLKLMPGDSFKGSMDISLPPPINVRVAAGLEICHPKNEEFTAALVCLDVEWPIPIPLLTSGMGMFGILGMFAMHYERNQDPTQTALDWFENSAKGNVTSLNAWKANANTWAFGLGTVIGTLEGGFLVNAKGMMVFELPGPKLLLFMNADILKERTHIHNPDEKGSILAAIELSPDKLTMGLVLDYHKIKPLLEFRIPVGASFDFHNLDNWYLDIGGIPPYASPVSIKFLEVFRAYGYLLIHGNGIPYCGEEFPIGPLDGFSVAAGIRAAFTWGPEDIGLYLKVAARADVGISFKPFLIIGDLSVGGQLHLFIIGIEASAPAVVKISPADQFHILAKVCGSVDFFFFEVSGCVTLQIGPDPRMPDADPLVRAMSLHSRTPALLPGSAVDIQVDGSLGDASYYDEHKQWIGEMPVVPIDAIPVLQMEMRPAVDQGCSFLNTPISSKMPKPPNDWMPRGGRFYRYTIKSINLSATTSNCDPLNPVVGVGDTPVVWWDRTGKPTGGDDTDVQLALLSATPDPTPAAAERTKSLDDRVERRWGYLCKEIAPPTRVFWTFRESPSGPSTSGWTLRGVPWPDPPGTVRGNKPDTALNVSEPWRSGNSLADGLVDVDPAYIHATQGITDRFLVAPHTGLKLQPAVDDQSLLNLLQTLRSTALDSLADAIRLDNDGFHSIRVLLFVHPVVLKNEYLILRGLNEKGHGNGFEKNITQTSSRIIHHLGDLPSDWTYSLGPWKEITEGVCGYWFKRFGHLEVPLVLFETVLPKDTCQVEIGLNHEFRDDSKNKLPNWELLIIEGQSEAEIGRFNYDTEVRKQEINVVDGLLNYAKDGNRALLHPDAIYTVELTYEVEVTNNPKNGPDGPPQPGNQSFRFKTDNEPPNKLDPWVMATDPGQFQSFFFFGDPIRIVFSTDSTRKFFSAYGRELWAVVKAASNKHPKASPSLGFVGSEVKLDDSLCKSVAANVMTPFESALRNAVPCIETSNEKLSQEQVNLKMKLQPLTDYILDLKAVDPNNKTESDAESYPMFRRHFSTSRYENVKAFASDLDVAVKHVNHRWIANTEPLAKLAAQSSGSSDPLKVREMELEDALRQVRWGDLARPTTPRLTVIWQDGPAGTSVQPFALLIETTEPIWRWRDVPEEVKDEHDTYRYELVSEVWLDMFESTAGNKLVSRFVYSTSCDRTLVILKPASKGSKLPLSLRRYNHKLFEGNTNTEVVELQPVSLEKAPWED
ncbi:hypothetical protein ACFU6E_13400 [Bacillus cereus]|uniref:hypothetical protein n=1 Tax=Bacillus cereus TaxID=1396 RepID=UPI00366FAFE8